jgi:hypothetical protein
MMKKIFGLTLFIMLLSFMLATEIQQSNVKPNRNIAFATRPNKQSRNAPNVEFVTEPVPLIENYYDFFPGGYNHTPMVLQPQVTNSGFPADGIYIGFQARETTDSNRRVYFAYLNNNEQLVQIGKVSANNVWEGFPAIAIDPITANPLVAYHRMSENYSYDCYMSYDLYHVLAAPGFWKAPFIAIDNPEVGQSHTGAINNEFIFPRIAIGPSPIVYKKRCYILADNVPQLTSHNNDVCGYNPIIGFSDFDGDLMVSQMELEFEFSTIPELDELHSKNIARSHKDIVVGSDGQVALVGFYDTTFFIVYSEDYGENFTYYETNGRFDLWNPQNLDGSFVFDSTPFAYPSPVGKNFNAIFTEYESKILIMSTMTINTEKNYKDGLYFPQFNYPKIFQYAIEYGELYVDVVNLQITGNNSGSGNPVEPWDMNGDGEPDEYDENGNVIIPLAFPGHYYSSDQKENYNENGIFRLSSFNYENSNVVVAMWQDFEKVYWSHQNEEGYEDWFDKPEILVAISYDYGNDWSEPAYLNAKEGDENYFPELNGMIPVFVYPTYELEALGYDSCKLHFFFTDDYSYGSSVIGNGVDNGSMLYYATLGIDLYQCSSDKNMIPVCNSKLISNYPNPFNPSTTIQFKLAEESEVSMEIYNIKGQKVKTLTNEFLLIGKHERIWDGKDENKQSVSSGIYFCKLRSSKYSAYRKMILLK